MLCDLCGKNDAYIFIEQSTKNGKRKMNLCPSCASSRGIIAGQSSSSKTNVDSIFQEISEKNESLNTESQKICPACGRSLFDIKMFKKAGCPECYTVFSEEIKAFMKANKMETSWKGLMPKHLKGFRSSIAERNALQAKLKKAVSEENYEKAAVYRDFLRALDKGFATQKKAEKNGQQKKTESSGKNIESKGSNSETGENYGK